MRTKINYNTPENLLFLIDAVQNVYFIIYKYIFLSLKKKKNIILRFMLIRLRKNNQVYV